jgi:hypothetical protein
MGVVEAGVLQNVVGYLVNHFAMFVMKTQDVIIGRAVLECVWLGYSYGKIGKRGLVDSIAGAGLPIQAALIRALDQAFYEIVNLVGHRVLPSWL